MATHLVRPQSRVQRRRKKRKGPAIKPQHGVSDNLARQITAEVVTPLFRNINRTVRAASGNVVDIQEAIRYLGVLSVTDRARVLKMFGGTVEHMARLHKQEFRLRMFHFLGLDITYALKDDALAPVIMQRIDDGVQRITTLPQKQIDRLSVKIQKLMADSDTAFSRAAVLDLVQEQANYAQSHARLIARDQVSKATGSFNNVRQVQAGFSQYTWSSSNDNRVRPTHMANEGMVFEWNNAPATGHPGEDIQCRCVALADVSSWVRPPQPTL